MAICINRLIKKYNIGLLLLVTALCCGVAHSQSTALKGPNDLLRPSNTKGGLKGPQTTAPELLGERHGPINNDDTLWNIAKTYRPSTAVNMIQMMVALQRYNPQAFENGNLNELINDEYIKIPPSSFIASVNLNEAKVKFEADARAWQSKRKSGNFSRSSENRRAPKPIIKTPKQAEKAPVKEVVQTSNTVTKDQTIQANNVTTKSPKSDTKAEVDAKDEQLGKLQKQFGASISNMQSLLDQNKALYSRLDTVNEELDRLRTEMSDLKGLDGKVSKLQEQQQELTSQTPQTSEQPNVEVEKIAPVTNDTSNSSNSTIAIIALSVLAPILLLGGLAFVLFRKKSNAAPEQELPSESMMNIAEEPELIAQELADEMAAEDLFGSDDLLDELEDSDISDFTDLSDELLVDGDDQDIEQVPLQAADEDDGQDDVFEFDDGADEQDDSTEITASAVQTADNNDDFSLLDQEGLDALFDNSDDTPSSVELTDSAVLDIPEEDDSTAVAEPDVEMSQPAPPADDAQPDTNALVNALDLEVEDESLEKLMQLDNDIDDVISDELMESIVTEINTKSDEFERVATEVIDEIEQVEQLEQMLGTTELDLSDDLVFENEAISADTVDSPDVEVDDTVFTDASSDDIELPATEEIESSPAESDTDELSQALADFDDDVGDSAESTLSVEDMSFDETDAVQAEVLTDQLTEQADITPTPDSEPAGNTSVQDTEQTDAAATSTKEDSQSPNLSTSFEMSMDGGMGGYSTMTPSPEVEAKPQTTDNDKSVDGEPTIDSNADNFEPTSIDSENDTENENIDESDLLKALEKTDFEELLESLADAPEQQQHGDPTQNTNASEEQLGRPDLNLGALLDEEVAQADIDRPSKTEQTSSYVDVEQLLEETEEEEFVEKPFNFEHILPPTDNNDNTADDDVRGLGGKLDLALAYLEIDDKSSAKTLLEDVKQRGTNHQREEAEQILTKLAD